MNDLATKAVGIAMKTETNTRAIEKRAIRAARNAGLGNRGQLSADFEHGQWWITNSRTGAEWSVCDAEGAFDGFCFEQITEGDDAEAERAR